jgi:hypothetical protein
MPSLVTGIISGFQGASAAHNAANVQSDADIKAGKMFTDVSQSANQTLLDSGQRAGAGVTAAAGQGSADVRNSAANGSNDVSTRATAAGGQVLDATGTAASNVTNAANTGAGASVQSGVDASGRLDPYAATGAQATKQLGTMLAPDGSLMKTFSAGDMEANDPGYAFRLQQQNQAMERSAAASGSAMGGGTLKALASYSGNLASQEYGAAFNRFQSTQQQQYNMLSGAAAQGQQAATTQGNQGIQTTEFGAGMNLQGATTAGQFNTQGAEYAGNANMQAGQFGASMNYDAAKTGAGYGINAAQYAGNADMTTTGEAAKNTVNAGMYNSDMTVNAGRAQASGDLGAAQSWNGMLSSIGSAGDNLVTGGMSGFGGGGPDVNTPTWNPAGSGSYTYPSRG